MTTLQERSQAGRVGQCADQATAAVRIACVTRYEGLTDGQEAFAQAYVRLGNGAEAYRVAYGADMRRKHLGERGRRLRKLPKVAARIVELGGECHPQLAADVVTEDAEWAPPPSQQAADGRSILGKASAGVEAPTAVLAAAEPGVALVDAKTPASDVTAEIESAAIVAFDDAAPDVVRLIALRAVSAGLARLRRERHSRVVVSISVGGVVTDAPSPPPPMASAGPS